MFFVSLIGPKNLTTKVDKKGKINNNQKW